MTTEEMVEGIGTAFGLTVEQMCARHSTDPLIRKARVIAVYILRRVGVKIVTVCTALHTGDCTVWKYTKMVEQEPSWKAEADALLLRLDVLPRDIHERLDQILATTDAAAPVRAFIEGSVLGERRHAAALCLAGLHVLARDERLRHTIQDALWKSGHRGYAGRVEYRANQVGVALAGGPWAPPINRHSWRGV